MKQLVTIPLQSGKKLCFNPQPLADFFNASHGKDPEKYTKEFGDAMTQLLDEMRKTNASIAYDVVAVAHAIITNCKIT